MIEIAVDRESFSAWYRVIVPAYAGTPYSGMGAARQGGRFNRPGQEALYLSLDEPTALAEYRQDNPWLPPGTICTFFVDHLKVLIVDSFEDIFSHSSIFKIISIYLLPNSHCYYCST